MNMLKTLQTLSGRIQRRFGLLSRLVQEHQVFRMLLNLMVLKVRGGSRGYLLKTVR